MGESPHVPRLMDAVSQPGHDIRIRNTKALWPTSTRLSLWEQNHQKRGVQIKDDTHLHVPR